MLMIQVGLSVQNASKLESIFYNDAYGVVDDVERSSLTENQKWFLELLVRKGFVSRLVSDWIDQEECYSLTDIGKDVLRIKKTELLNQKQQP